MAALFRDLVGRGPRLTRTYSEESLVVVLLEDTMTKAERMLADEDRLDLIREMRRNWQTAIGERVKGVIEELTGRAVYAVLSDHSVLPDYATLAFVLEPRRDKPASSEDAEADSNHTSSVSRTSVDRGRQREISRGMVALFKETVGRGPTSARTYFHDDVVMTLLEDTLTKAERTLAEDDREALVREVRRQFQGALREQAVELVEQRTSCTVKAFLSDNSVYPDYALELFVLDKPSKTDDEDRGSQEEPVALR